MREPGFMVSGIASWGKRALADAAGGLHLIPASLVAKRDLRNKSYFFTKPELSGPQSPSLSKFW